MTWIKTIRFYWVQIWCGIFYFFTRRSVSDLISKSYEYGFSSGLKLGNSVTEAFKETWAKVE